MISNSVSCFFLLASTCTPFFKSALFCHCAVCFIWMQMRDYSYQAVVDSKKGGRRWSWRSRLFSKVITMFIWRWTSSSSSTAGSWTEATAAASKVYNGARGYLLITTIIEHTKRFAHRIRTHDWLTDWVTGQGVSYNRRFVQQYKKGVNGLRFELMVWRRTSWWCLIRGWFGQ